MIKRILTVFLWVGWLLVPGQVWAQEVDEDALFGEEDSVIAVEEKLDESISEELNGASVTFSGEIGANFGYDITRDCLDGDEDIGDNPYSSSVEGDFLLDVRLGKGIKSFANLWAEYSPQNDETGDDDDDDDDDEHFDTLLKEFFVDVNIARKVYFRAGKQYLKWGQGYFWNPTDLISEDRKDFLDMDARLEGNYGLKMHIPFGTKFNIYGFVNTTEADTAKDFSVAGKLEYLLPNDIEISVSAWAKDNYIPVYGIDFATHKFNTDFRGEISFSHGDNRHRLKVVDVDGSSQEFVDTQVTDEWVPRVCVGFTKYFDFREVNDRISLTGEFYYNDGGYDSDMLDDPETRLRFLEGGYFESGNYGKYYAAVFSSLNKFIVSDMTLNMNAIGNLSDSSFIISSGIGYEITHNASLSFDVRGYLGEGNREYTVNGNALSAEVSVSLVF